MRTPHWTSATLALVCAALLSSAPAAAQDFARHGAERQLQLDAGQLTYHEPDADGTWLITVQGPTRLALGLRLPLRPPAGAGGPASPAKGKGKGKTPRPSATPAEVQAELSASLDGGPAVLVPLHAAPDSQAALAAAGPKGSAGKAAGKGKAKGKTNGKRAGEGGGAALLPLSVELAVVFEIPAGQHELALRVSGAPGAPALTRLLTVAPAQAIVAAAFAAPAPAAADSVARPAASAPAQSAPETTAASTAASTSATANAPATKAEPPTAPAAAPTGGGAGEPAAKVLVARAESSASNAGSAASGAVGLESASPAASEPALAVAQPATRRELLGLVAGVELGGVFPQVVSRLGTSFDVIVELGYLLPVLDQRLQVFGDFLYTRPGRSASVSDPRLIAAGEYEYTLVEQELVISLGAQYRFLPPGSAGLNPYALVAGRLDLQRSTIDGSVGGAAFGANDETRTSGGLVVGAGVEWALGPGALAGELSFAVADLDHTITGNASIGGLALHVGYHLFF